MPDSPERTVLPFFYTQSYAFPDMELETEGLCEQYLLSFPAYELNLPDETIATMYQVHAFSRQRANEERRKNHARSARTP